MPSSNGVYSLPAGYLAVTGQVIQATQHNPPLEDIAAALTARLSRDGTAAMTGSLQLAAGTVALPGAVFSTDLTSGLYKTTNGIGVAIAGVKVAEFLAGGLVGARVVGELVPFTGASVPSSLWVFPYGQTLSRTTYAALWAFAQAEIAAGNTFYNNGDGSTTFGIGDVRGRTVAGADGTGGPGANRLTTGNFGANPSVIGSAGGVEKYTLLATQLPSSIPYTDNGHTHAISGRLGASSAFGTIALGGSADNGAYSGLAATTATTGIVINPSGGVAHNNTQPTIIANYILFAGA